MTKIRSAKLNLYEGAALVGLPPATFYTMGSHGIIPCQRKGGELTVSRDSLLNWARLWGERLSGVCSATEVK